MKKYPKKYRKAARMFRARHRVSSRSQKRKFVQDFNNRVYVAPSGMAWLMDFMK